MKKQNKFVIVLCILLNIEYAILLWIAPFMLSTKIFVQISTLFCEFVCYMLCTNK